MACGWSGAQISADLALISEEPPFRAPAYVLGSNLLISKDALRALRARGPGRRQGSSACPPWWPRLCAGGPGGRPSAARGSPPPGAGGGGGPADTHSPMAWGPPLCRPGEPSPPPPPPEKGGGGPADTHSPMVGDLTLGQGFRPWDTGGGPQNRS